MKGLFKNLRVGRKLMAAFATVIALYILTVILSVLSIRDLGQRMEALYSGPFANVETSHEVSTNILQIVKNLAIISTTDNVVDEEEYMQIIQETANNVDAGITELNSGYISGGEKVDQLADEYGKLKEARQRVYTYLEQNNDQAAFDVYFKEYEPQAETVISVVDEVEEASKADAEASLETVKKQNVSVITFLSMLAAFCVLITIFLWIAITRSTVQPIIAVKGAASQIANGQLDVKLDYESANEFGELADDIRSTARSLSLYVSELRKGLLALGAGRLNYTCDIKFKGDFIALGESMEEIGKMLRNSMRQISSSSELVSGGAEQVSDGAQVLAQGASEQASSIEELAVSINEIAESVGINAEKAVKSRDYASEVRDRILENNQQMEKLQGSIKEIQENSKEITGIVKEIEDIAFQTNILALNASVEAARAGDAGKGFAVVAGEVRRLAAKTASASKLTADLAEKNSEAVREGYEAASMTARTLKTSVEGAETVNEMVGDISRLSEQQADAIAQIRKSVEQISDIVQGNSATSEESAAASEELSAQAQMLRELVEQFEL